MSANQTDDHYSPEETVRRRDDAIRRALNTPPKPNSEYAGKRERAQKSDRSRVVRPIQQGQKKSKLRQP